MKRRGKILIKALALVFVLSAIAVNSACAAEPSLFIVQPAQPPLQIGPEAGTSAQLKPIELYLASNAAATKQRILLLENYLARYNSPLAKEAATFILVAEHYQLDWRLLPAISGVESTFAQRYIRGTYNAWGWGGGNIYFANWPEAIDTIGKSLRQKYMNQWGAMTVEQIAPLYAPPSATWAKNVRYFMQDITNFEQNYPLLTLKI